MDSTYCFARRLDGSSSKALRNSASACIRPCLFHKHQPEIQMGRGKVRAITDGPQKLRPGLLNSSLGRQFQSKEIACCQNSGLSSTLS